ncbi:MAG TPA: aldose 1-epimerase [Ferruginibacter sp.]|nr:aldose 1-epimerase [Ferruginibacter sp.]HMP19701.1 aldose 1-epimerase [Ferruginibacter sp.]
MFTVSTRQWKGTDMILLSDMSSKTHAEIIPSCGAILHAFSVAYKGGMLNVIEQHDSPDDFKKNVGAKGFKSCKLSPFVCRVKKGQYRFGNGKYTVTKFMLDGNAIHGLIYDAPFTVKYTYADEEHAGVALEYQYRGEEKGYPFHFDCVITYHLKKNNELIISTDIFNKEAEELIPVQDGWHPYFTFGGKIDDLLLELKSSEKIEFDRKMIPTGKKTPFDEYATAKPIGNTFFDDCFVLKAPGRASNQPSCILRDADKKIQVEIRPDKNYPYLQLYTPPHRQSIAIENLSGAPDGFNNAMGVVVLPPDANKIFTTTYKVVLL